MSTRTPVRVAPDGEIIGWVEKVESALFGIPYLGYRAIVATADGATEIPWFHDSLEAADSAVRAEWDVAHAVWAEWDAAHPVGHP